MTNPPNLHPTGGPPHQEAHKTHTLPQQSSQNTVPSATPTPNPTPFPITPFQTPNQLSPPPSDSRMPTMSDQSTLTNPNPSTKNHKRNPPLQYMPATHHHHETQHTPAVFDVEIYGFPKSQNSPQGRLYPKARVDDTGFENKYPSCPWYCWILWTCLCFLVTVGIVVGCVAYSSKKVRSRKEEEQDDFDLASEEQSSKVKKINASNSALNNITSQNPKSQTTSTEQIQKPNKSFSKEGNLNKQKSSKQLNPIDYRQYDSKRPRKGIVKAIKGMLKKSWEGAKSLARKGLRAAKQLIRPNKPTNPQNKETPNEHTSNHHLRYSIH